MKFYQLINTTYDNLKCIDSSKNEYKATHIYFRKDNYTFNGNYRFGIKLMK